MENYIGLNIRYLCSKKNISMKQLGELLEIKQPTLSGYVSGRVEPNIATIQKMCKYFEVTIDNFINVNLESFKYTDKPKNVSVLREPKAQYNSESILIAAKDKLIVSLEKQISLLEDKVNTLETDKARAS